jgi:hypothetical protein
MQECSDSIELVEFPSAQHCAGDNAADRVHPKHSSKCFVIVDTVFLPIAFDDQSRFARSVGFSLEDPFAANHTISGRDVLSSNLLPCSVFEKRRIFFLDGSPPFQLLWA